ncbi:MAG: hypothetical protein SGPRY_005822 [Prymnesium sp.]
MNGMESESDGPRVTNLSELCPSAQITLALLNRHTTLSSVAECHGRYQAVVDMVKSTKAQLEAAISKHFDGRRVNLMGEINSI